MEYQSEDLSKAVKRITVTFTAEETQRFEQEAATALQQEVQLPGFRKGKVPLSVLRRKFAGLLHNETLEKAVHYALIEIQRAHPQWQILSTPKVTEHHHREDGSLQVTMEIEILPTIELDERYKTTLHLRDLPAVAEAEIEQTLEQIREHYGTLETQDSPADQQSIVSLELQELDASGLPIIGKSSSQPIQIPVQEVSDPQLQQQLLGKSRGDEFVYTTTGESGQQSQYRVRISEVQRRKPAELTEEKIAEITGGAAKTVEELREHIRDFLRREREKARRESFQHQIREQLLKLYEDQIELPPRFVETFLHNWATENQIDLNTLSPEQQQQLQQETLQHLKWILLKQALIRAENISVSAEDFKDIVIPINEQTVIRWEDLPGETQEKFRKDFEATLLERKLLDRLIELATIVPAEEATESETKSSETQDA